MMKEVGGSTTSPNGQHASKNPHGLALACRECQRKKIKCDRKYPCTQCSRANLPCQISTRKPRAKIAKTVDAELRNRIAKLEKLVESFQDEDGKLPNAEDLKAISQLSSKDENLRASDTPPSINAVVNSDHGSPSSPIDATSPATSKYVAGSFWSTLTSEVKALADAFEEDGPNSEPDTTPETTPPGPYALDGSNSTAQYELIFCPPGALYIMPGAMIEPEPAIALDLLNAYLNYVEPIYKLLHVPTLKAFMADGQPYMNRPADAPCNKALKAAIYFAAANAYTEEECESKFGKSQDLVVLQYRRMVDIALYQADPLNTTEVATIQACALYIASARITDSSRRAWSLVGMLVRVGRAINIHRELQGESIYMAEMKRRLWYFIVFLDSYASIDRGSEPAIHPDTYNRRLPTNCNDEDFGESSTTITPRPNEIADMTVSLIAMEASDLTLRLAIPEDMPSGQPWQKRLEIAYAFQKKINEQYFQHCNIDIHLHRIAAGIGAAACHSLILRAVRPMQLSPNHSAPRVDSPWVMELALNILRHCHDLHTGISGRWRRMPWVPWHGMAVALAGLCSIRDTPLANEAWELVEKTMATYAPSVADTKDGMLWKPLEKLRAKAEAFRDEPRQNSRSEPPNKVQQPAVVQPVPNVNMWNGVDQFGNMPLPDPSLNLATAPFPNDMTLDPLTAPISASVFDFPPDMAATLPTDNSWLDWEGILQDMEDVRTDGVGWM
ncbi:C6 finger domain transcription factor adaR [Pseudocercospora fuligena]|uniref:C6 finger domain transcription factor adaR n=1 Tax=Pseudocercospora fuligena TaxID=685502 RepID=A0A8H6VE70_9PEZI|nr:C6 finger domain transcription factor adaR [Pseudocercospora fuligena]